MEVSSNTPAVVTGGASGLGEATARAIAAKGAKVAIFDMNEEKGEAVAKDIGGIFCKVNVMSDEDVDAGFAKAREAHGQERILVNCAGVDITGTVADTEPDRWQRVLDVNLSSVYRTCRKAIPHMISRGGGSIVNIASVQGMFGWRNYAAYAA